MSEENIRRENGSAAGTEEKESRNFIEHEIDELVSLMKERNQRIKIGKK